jgi:hypothetical protein
MSRLTALTIEDFAIKLFERLGHVCSHAPYGDTPLARLTSGEVRGAA